MEKRNLEIPSIDYLKKNFHDYYKNNNIQLPDRFGRREFADKVAKTINHNS